MTRTGGTDQEHVVQDQQVGELVAGVQKHVHEVGAGHELAGGGEQVAPEERCRGRHGAGEVKEKEPGSGPQVRVVVKGGGGGAPGGGP